MLSFTTALWEVWVLANWWRRLRNRGFFSSVDLGDDFNSQKLHVSPVYLLVMKYRSSNSEYSVDSEALDYIPDFDIETKDNCDS